MQWVCKSTNSILTPPSPYLIKTKCIHQDCLCNRKVDFAFHLVRNIFVRISHFLLSLLCSRIHSVFEAYLCKAFFLILLSEKYSLETFFITLLKNNMYMYTKEHYLFKYINYDTHINCLSSLNSDSLYQSKQEVKQ